MKRLSRVLGALRLGAVLDQKNPANNEFIAVQLYETIRDSQGSLAAASYATNRTIMVNDNLSGEWYVAGVTSAFSTASASATVQVEVANGTTAPGSGTNQLQSALALSGTANTPSNGTLIASPTKVTAGGRINLIFAGTSTGLANGCVTVLLKRAV